MKRILAIFLLFQMLSANSLAAEVMRLPFLVQHYLEHEKETISGLGFGAYLTFHYVQGDHLEKDHCGEKLPFKHCQDCCSHQATQTSFLVPELVLTLSIPDPVSPVCTSNEQSFHSSYSGSIFQPPKFS